MSALHPSAAFYAGDTWQIKGALFYADGTPFNLNTGAAVVWTLKDCHGDEVEELSLAAGIVVENAACGLILITVTPEQSAALAKGEYTDRLVATDPEGFVSTQWIGTITVRV